MNHIAAHSNVSKVTLAQVKIKNNTLYQKLMNNIISGISWSQSMAFCLHWRLFSIKYIFKLETF